MNRTQLLGAALLAVSAGGLFVAAMPAPSLTVRPATPPGTATSASQVARATSRPGVPPNEEQWIVSDVAGAIGGMAGFGTGASQLRPTKLEVKEHLWSPETYVALAAASFGPGRAGEPRIDLDARTPLTHLTAGALLDQSARLSDRLARNMRSPDAHESAALLVGAFALRESAGQFTDVRPALSRMASHLAIAHAMRGTDVASVDGALAGIVLRVLVGHQQKALDALRALEPRLTTAADRAWGRALRLRITGDWRQPLGERATLLERLEQARAIRERVGRNAFLDYLDTFEPEPVTDWQRIAFFTAGTVEIGHRFADETVDRELAEASQVWSVLHQGAKPPAPLTAALNALPRPSPSWREGQTDVVSVLDWGMWAAAVQRHLGHALTARSQFYDSVGSPDRRRALVTEVKTRFADLRLYPVILRRLVLEPADYERSMTLARELAATMPQVITAAAWHFIEEKPSFVVKAAPFPFETTWWAEAVPTGTAFDLANRSLRPYCPRPPTLAQARLWATEAPFSVEAKWSPEWYAVTGKPSVASVRRAFGPLLDYDADPLRRIITHLDLSVDEHIELARRLCGIAEDSCDDLAHVLVREAREAEAIQGYERWIADERDRVGVANSILWLVLRYAATGNVSRAEALATMAANVYSHTGLRTYALLLDSLGRHTEAETTYEAIADRYEDTVPLGAFKVRTALRTKDDALEREGWALMQAEFPTGPQEVVMHALDAPPRDGVSFVDFGRRAQAAGLRPRDIVVGVDRWRVHNWMQMRTINSLSLDEAITYTVWRDGRYMQVRTRVPERYLALSLSSYTGGAVATR